MPMLAQALERRDEPGMKQRGAQEISVTIGDEERTFAVRVTREKAGPGDVGSVVTFDDITELVSAQRTSAWADVARRIAHEIKNPLTPIILSAERIRRKYGKVIVRRPRDVRQAHRDDRAAGRRHQDDGGRVRVVRAHSEARDGAWRPEGRGDGFRDPVPRRAMVASCTGSSCPTSRCSGPSIAGC